MDLIDRQEAIDRIEAIFPVDPHANECAEGVAIGAALAKQYIETLPSAQPEIVRCKDCKWFNDIGCAIYIVDDSDKPTENDYCSYGERKDG